MLSVVAGSTQLRLPARISKRLQGRKIEIQETRERILLKPVEDTIDPAMGLFKGTKVTVDNFLALMARDKELEK